MPGCYGPKVSYPYLVWLTCIRNGERKSLYLYLFQAFEERVANVSLAFDLMQDAGLPKPKARPEDIVNLDLKSTLRVLYNLFTKYKHLS